MSIACEAQTGSTPLGPAFRGFLLLGLGLFLIVFHGWVSGAAAGEPGLVVLPAEIEFRDALFPQRLLIERVQDGRATGQVVDDIAWTSSDPAVVKVEAGVAIPLANGEAVLQAKTPAGEAQCRVRVSEFDNSAQWSFRNHVESVLTKAGCNSGACHGAAAGKNGFKISLRGYDPEGDFDVLTRQSRGRRIVPHDPGRSLVLTKPSGGLPHRGGLRLAVGSRGYEVLARWIAAGTAPPRADDAHIDHLEILPERSRMAAPAEQQLIVRAHFSDGRIEDVTEWCKYTSSNASVAEVDDVGHVRVVGPGEGAITAWYLSRVVIASITSPYPQSIAPERFALAAGANLIDRLVMEKLADLNVPPSPRADDGVFFRRAWLDTLGVLPTLEETQAFLADTDPEKRAKLVDRLLKRDELVDYWSYKWSDLLLVNGERLPSQAMWAYYRWIRDCVAANRPWDEMARQLLTATGSTLENGAASFYLLHQDPLDLAETTTVAFLGMSINCARCHNHPMEKWTNDQYFAMANLFGRVRTKNLANDAERVVFASATGDVVQPLRGRPQPPAPLDGTALPLDDTADRRAHLAAWLIAPENPYFARAIVNRVWANFFAVGLVEPIDDMRLTNPATNEALLSGLADFLRNNRYDLRALMRLILTSQTYQRSSETLPENAADNRFYARYYPRRLMAEVLLDAVSNVCAAPTAFPGYPTGWRALQLPDSNVSSYFLKTFGRPERVITCECERTAEPSMVQVLHLSNGDVLNQKLAAAGNRIEQLLAANGDLAAAVDALYWQALGRAARDEERAPLLAELAQVPEGERRQSLEDLFWSVLTSKEFLFNH